MQTRLVHARALHMIDRRCQSSPVTTKRDEARASPRLPSAGSEYNGEGWVRACVLSRPAQCGTRSMGMDRNKMWPQIAIVMVMVAVRVVGGVWCVVACGFFIFIALYFYFIYLYFLSQGPRSGHACPIICARS